MSDQRPDILERLEGFEILPEQPSGLPDAVLILWTKSTRFEAIVNRQMLLRLAAEAREQADAGS